MSLHCEQTTVSSYAIYVPCYHIGYYTYIHGYALISLKDGAGIKTKDKEVTLKDVVFRFHRTMLRCYYSNVFYISYFYEDDYEETPYYMVLTFVDLESMYALFRREVCKKTFGDNIVFNEILVYEREGRMYEITETSAIPKELMPKKINRKQLVEQLMNKLKEKYKTDKEQLIIRRLNLK